MNKTINYLLGKEIRRWIVITYDNYVSIDKSRVDVKNNNIRFWDCNCVVDKLPLKDLDLTENEANKIINNIALSESLSLSNHPITKNFKSK